MTTERESESSWCCLALNVSRQQNLPSPVTAFLRCAAECAQQGISPISAYSPSVVSTCLVFLLTQTNKGLITHLGNSVYNRRRRNNLSDHCSVRYIRRPTDKQRVEKPANNTCIRLNSENTWNSSLVTKSMIIFINLQTTEASLVCVSIQCWQDSWTHHRSVSWVFSSAVTVTCTWQALPARLESHRLKSSRQSLSRDSPSWRPTKLSLHRHGSRSCVCVLFQRVVGYKKKYIYKKLNGMTWIRTEWTPRCL